MHPYRHAWETRDLSAWGEALAPDVTLHSPIIGSSFQGREAAVELFDVLFKTFGRLEITHEFAEGNNHAFFWRGDLGKRTIEGADLIRLGADGKIVEARVLIRPLVGIAAFAAAVGPPLAAKQGRGRALLTRILNLPLRGVIAGTEAIAPRLVQRHKG
jgi:ketosteroid isomerase-like protein